MLDDMGRPATLVLLLVAITSCSAPSNPEQGNSAPVPPARPRSLLTPEQRTAAPISREWLVGYRGYEGCGELETALWADGTYTMGDGGGRWSFSGTTLTVVQERRPSVEYMQVRLGDGGQSVLRKLRPNEMQVDWGGAGGRFVRCD